MSIAVPIFLRFVRLKLACFRIDFLNMCDFQKILKNDWVLHMFLKTVRRAFFIDSPFFCLRFPFRLNYRLKQKRAALCFVLCAKKWGGVSGGS